jgi:iron complex outermembrane receptor protein
MDYDDIQVRVPAGVAQVEQNVGEAEISGAELELKWQLGATWFIEAGVGYTDAEYTDIDIDVSSIPTNPDGSLTVDLDDPFAVIQEGNEFDHVPEWSANASVSKEFDLDNAGFLLVRFSGSYHSSYFNEPLNLPQVKTPSEDIWDIAAIWTSPTERYSVNAGVKNLTDEEYRTTGYFNPTIGTIENIFDRGRQWYVTGRYNY